MKDIGNGGLGHEMEMMVELMVELMNEENW